MNRAAILPFGLLMSASTLAVFSQGAEGFALVCSMIACAGLIGSSLVLIGRLPK